ncbi:uncharacterized protein LOC124690837 [Lolium rigidum]|uniref:uncharacterized protein LOC124690837 n=1 Tax=Lolium rigidum TaxID=89674 RepID=UPI001F5CB486|nr:uncharacterized protein LOC124690837 [Lolium rigidum]
MATTAAHAGRTAAPSQAKPSPDQRRNTQHHRGGTTEGTAPPGTPASGESPQTRATLVAVGLGANREGLQSQIDADHLMRRRKLCNLLKSRVESPEFLQKLDNIQKSVYQNGTVDETISWDIVSAADIWDDKNMNVSDDSEDGYVLVKQEDIVDGIACFMAAYLLSLKETKELTPNQLQDALSKTFSTKKRKGKLQKAWAGTQVIYNVASWSATAIGIYQNPAILKAATAAFWTSCRVVSKFL